MAFLAGVAIALGVGLFAHLVGLSRERGFYPTVLIVVASYYLLFAVMGGSPQALLAEAPVAAVFVVLAVLGLRMTPWLLVVGLAGHGLMDAVHPDFIANPGAPAWWPMFCMGYDVAAAAILALQLRLSARRGLAAVLVVGLAGLALSWTGSQAATRDVLTADAGGTPIAYRVLGQARPALVMIAGLGDGMDSFRDVAPVLAQNATVIVYDRAGYGASGPAGSAKDAAAADAELLAVLKASGVPGPYWVLGHSLGGLYAEYFAAHHPELTAGLILEESRPADFTQRCLAARIDMCLPPAGLVRLMPPGARAEFAGLEATTTEVAAVPPAGVRTLVLSRPLPKSAKPFESLWSQAQDDLAARHGAQRLAAPAGGHYVHKDQRDWFVTQVRAFLAEAK